MIFYRNIVEPKELNEKPHLYTYDYEVIKKYQKKSGITDFATALYIALIAEIIFLYFGPSLFNYNCDIINQIHSNIKIIDLYFLYKIYYIPIAFTVAFIVWRAKNYLIDELPIDVDTRWDKLLYLVTPILFSFFVYYLFNPCNLLFWLVSCSFFFFTTLLISLKRYYSLCQNNRYRIKIPKRRKQYSDFNLYGYRQQVWRWSLLLIFETFALAAIGLLNYLYQKSLLEKILTNNHTSFIIDTPNINLFLLLIINYLACLIICLIIYYMTVLSKSVRPVSLESYEKELELHIASMGYDKNNPTKSISKKWALLEIQYRALEYLRTSDIQNKDLILWKHEMDEIIKD